MPNLLLNWKRGSWLRSGNRYETDTVNRIRDDARAGSTISHSDMSTYVAASAIVHCFDGWSYLGHALQAEMAGDPETARHLGYYAELRAGMSLLACGGIGVFQRQHILVTLGPKCEVSQQAIPTHEFVWEALQVWVDSQEGRDALLQAVKPGGQTLEQWLTHLSFGSQFLTSNWLISWGLDLARLAEDRDARNVSSYRPTAFVSPGPRSIEDTMKSTLQFWKVCDPDAYGGFPILDQHLLQRSLAYVWQGRNSSSDIHSYQQQLQVALGSLGLTRMSIDYWTKFLAHANLQNSHSLISDASKTDDEQHVDHSKQVLARATLLLRLATGCSAELLKEAGTEYADALSFWRLSPLVQRRLLLDPNSPSSSEDLWADVEEAVESIERWLDEKGTRASRHALWREQAAAATTLGMTERAFLWGVGL